MLGLGIRLIFLLFAKKNQIHVQLFISVDWRDYGY